MQFKIVTPLMLCYAGVDDDATKYHLQGCHLKYECVDVGMVI